MSVLTIGHLEYQREHHHHHHHHHFRRPPSPPETSEQYSARLRKQVEEQEKAAECRTREEANRRANQEMERELGMQTVLPVCC